MVQRDVKSHQRRVGGCGVGRERGVERKEEGRSSGVVVVVVVVVVVRESTCSSHIPPLGLTLYAFPVALFPRTFLFELPAVLLPPPPLDEACGGVPRE